MSICALLTKLNVKAASEVMVSDITMSGRNSDVELVVGAEPGRSRTER